jgi:hypothetical protein
MTTLIERIERVVENLITHSLICEKQLDIVISDLIAKESIEINVLPYTKNIRISRKAL